MDFTEATLAFVGAVTACLPSDGWQAALLDIELREVPEGFDSDYVGLVLVKGPAGALDQDQFALGPEARQAAMALYMQRKEAAAEDNAGFVLEIEPSGAYRLRFKQSVKRLNGIWDQAEEEFIDQYLKHYLRERSQ
ncbi:MAG: hypothetical protein AAGM21_10240 [Pseudomonadota bacterium]